MSAASKSYIPVPVPQPKRPRRSLPRSSRPIERTTPPVRPVSKVQPSTQERPQPLSLVQRVVAALTFSLLGSTLGLYAWTVYIPKAWDREFGKLEALQRNERHLLATNETLKHQLARQAERPETGFSSPRPFQTIFLRRSPGTKIQPVLPVRGETGEIPSRKAY